MAETDFKYDVFISYSHKDEEWVRNVLLPTLENYGLKVCIDYRDFIAGKPAIINMQDASEASRHTLLVLTPRWVESEWTIYESILSRTEDPSGLQRRTIPLLLEKCKPPKFISMLSWVDFTDKKRENEAWQNLFKSLDKEVEKIEVAKAEPESWHLAHPYPMPPNFTGREIELKMLDDWLADNTNRLFILRALGGFGKSALTWQWINTHVNPAEWTKLVWWSFYEGDASFEHFIEETLKYLKLEVPQGQRPQVEELLKAIQSQKILLIMDGFERALRAYSSMNAAYQGDDPKIEDNQLDCVNINAEFFLKGVCSLPNIKSKVLMTTRLTPRAIKPRGEFMLGCHEVELTSMQPADAVEFFHKQKIKGTYAEIETACALYGFHPLSLRLLAGRILKDFETPADILVAQKFKIDGDIIQQKHHVLEVSYNSLPPHEQKLLSTIACFRSPVELKTLEAIVENKVTLDNDLHDLVERGLLHFDDKNKKFDLHPIVRHYAYAHSVDLNRTHRKLANYFQKKTDQELPFSYRILREFQFEPEVFISGNVAPIIELYHHMVETGKSDDALELFKKRLIGNLYYYAGAYHSIIELLQVFFSDGEDKLPSFGWKSDKIFILHFLSGAYIKIGEPQKAITLQKSIIFLEENSKRRVKVAPARANLAKIQIQCGALRESASDLRKVIQYYEGVWGMAYFISECHLSLGSLLSYCGEWVEAQDELELALKKIEKKDFQAQSVIYFNRARLSLLRMRDSSKFIVYKPKLSIDFAKHSLKLTTEYEKKEATLVPDALHSHWVLGATYRSNGNLTEAEQNLSKAISMCRQINMVDHEANILLDLARLRYDQKNYEEAKSLAEEALSITERCGYVLQGADVNLFLAQYALEQEKDKAKAKAYAEEALKLATCDGPPYYYKVAYEEAERLLTSLNV